MTTAAPHILASPIDRDFVARLNALQCEELARALDLTPRDVIAKTVYQPAVQEDLQRRRERWDFDGSVVLGRIDTADERIYVGSKRVLDDGEPVLRSIDEPAVAEMWAATAHDPGEVRLKRHLQVQDWTIVEATTEFDHRRRPVGGEAPPPERPHGLSRLLDELVAEQSSLARLLREALDRVTAGAPTPADAPLAIADWNDRMAEAARMAGLDASQTDLAALREHVARNDRQRRRDAARILERVLREHPDLADVFEDMVNLPEEGLETMPSILAQAMVPKISGAGEGPWL